jgi:hypothetical protein
MPTIYDFDPRNLPERLHIAIGLAIASYAQTEDIVQQAIAGCCGLDIEYGKAITVHMTMPLRFSALRSVAEIRIDDLDLLDELDRHLDRLEECTAKRNGLAHSKWCRDPTTGDLYIVEEKARSRLEAELRPVSIEDVERDATLIYQAGIDLYAFLGEVNLLPILPTDYRPRAHKSRAERKKRREEKKKSSKPRRHPT